MRWIWNDESREWVDETGYARDRDFGNLQSGMSTWLKTLCGIMLQRAEARYLNFGMNMPIGFIVETDEFSHSPLGFHSREWMEKMAAADKTEANHIASDYFPWWERGYQAEFWGKCGKLISWMELPWRQPESAEEKERYQLVLDCFARAMELDRSVQIPSEEVAEIHSLLQKPQRDIPPPEGRIGFKRYPICQQFFGKWRIAVPGYFYCRKDPDREAMEMWFGGRSMWMSAKGLVDDNGAPGDARPTISSLVTDQDADEIIRFEKDHLAGLAKITRERDENGRSRWAFLGYTATIGGFHTLSIIYYDPADKEWASKVWRSVYHPPPA